MKAIKLDKIIKKINDDFSISGNAHSKTIDNTTTPAAANKKSLIWLKSSEKILEHLNNTAAEVIICRKDFDVPVEFLKSKCFIKVENPKLTFLRLVDYFFSEKPVYKIHSSAIISPNAKVNKKVSIGPHTFIGGEVVIGKGTIIRGNCFISNKVIIGQNVFINAGVVIGSEGFGYSRNDKGELEKFPHIGGVIIEDEVEIGANTCIDRGTLGDTIIRKGAKVDNLVHVAHNVDIGKHSLVIANTMIGGSTVIGDECWVAPSVSLMNGIKIGNKSTIGMSALVTKDIPEGETWAGVPAQPMDKFIALQKKLKNLL